MPSYALEADKSAARIMVYFTVGRDEAPATNVTLEQFQAHMAELASGDYSVLSLNKIIESYKNGAVLPANAVAITFDGGDKSILETAAPILEKHGFPYTVFIASERADSNDPRHLTWRDIKTLQKSRLITLGIHPQNYHDYTGQSVKTIRTQVNNATTRFREETGINPQFFSYPFGTFDDTYYKIIADYGFEAAFGQQSGVAYANDDRFALPRFTMTENFAHVDRFIMTAGALPLPVHDASPVSPLLTDNTPSIGFTIPDSLSNMIHSLSCFASGQEKPEINVIGERRVELRLRQAIGQTRFRVNCTLPVKTDETQRWRWFGRLFKLSEPALEGQEKPAQ